MSDDYKQTLGELLDEVTINLQVIWQNHKDDVVITKGE